MIEQQLERIANALEKIAGGINVEAKSLSVVKSVDVAETPETPAKRGRKAKVEEPSAVPSIEDVPTGPAIVEAPKAVEAQKTPAIEEVAAELRIFVTKQGKTKAIELLKRYGATRVSEIKPEDLSAIVENMRAAVKNG